MITTAKQDRQHKPTVAQFTAYQAMYDYFNRTLFQGKLPSCILNFSRQARTLGFFAPERWERGEDRSHEISLNPAHLKTSGPKDSASTLVHEMVHLWQQVFGKPSRRAYHNHEWAAKMEAVGLMPSNTAQPGGRKVGQKMSHYIIEGGAFERGYDAMPADILWPWTSGEHECSKEKKKPAAPSKVKYTCEECDANVWGKPGLAVVCGDCGEPFIEQ
jgi:predicted SprT family Zn-dependent metalloprotease